MTLALRYLLLSSLRKKGVTMLTNVTIEQFTENRVIIIREEEKQTLEADTIVWAAGTVPDTSLFDVVKSKVPGAYIIGDSREPRNILEAIKEGDYIGRTV